MLGRVLSALLACFIAVLVLRYCSADVVPPIIWTSAAESDNMTTAKGPQTQAEWKEALNSLPDNPDKIPAFFFGHGSPNYLSPPHLPDRGFGIDFGRNGRQVGFLQDFGPFLIRKYKPKAILVFSAHWETEGQRLVTDYGERNPLLYDYYGFDQWYYTNVDFKSRGDSAISNRVVQAFKDNGMKARTSPVMEARGRDGRGGARPGLDHGVFVPFSLMFDGHGADSEDVFDIPVIQASLDASLDSHDNEAVGRAVSELRKEGILILSGGLTVHTFEDRTAFDEARAKPIFQEWSQAITDSIMQPKSAAERQKAMHKLIGHPGCALSHPRLEHFMPLYVAAGAGNVEKEGAVMLNGLYGAQAIAFGV